MTHLPDPLLPPVFTRSSAARVGVSRGRVETRIASGQWRALRRGAFCRSETWDAADRTGRHLLEAEAALLVLTGPAWLSHASAAALRGLPLPRKDDGACSRGSLRGARPTGTVSP